MDVTAFTEFKRKLLDNCSRVIVGKDDAAEQIALCLIAGGHVLLEDFTSAGLT